MLRRLLLLILFPWYFADSLLCYNCSTTNHEWTRCAGDFAPSVFDFNSSRHLLVNCTGENAMCFVRSWSARAQHSWLVQRGCYLPASNDPLPRTMTLPTRAMTCRHERFPEAEYTVCLCQADWCNFGQKIIPFFENLTSCTRFIVIFILTYILFT